MNLTNNFPKLLVLTFVLVGVGLLISKLIERPQDENPAKVIVPELSQQAEQGAKVFAANCASCHGVNAAGTKKGPPLVHDIYNPGHHGDESFWFAARNGVRSHHWPYGNMPAQPQVGDDDLRALVQYVRELQLANGITFRPHKM